MHLHSDLLSPRCKDDANLTNNTDSCLAAQTTNACITGLQPSFIVGMSYSALQIYGLASWLACLTFLSALYIYSLASQLACLTFLSAVYIYSLASWLACLTFLDLCSVHLQPSFMVGMSYIHLPKTAFIHLHSTQL